MSENIIIDKAVMKYILETYLIPQFPITEIVDKDTYRDTKKLVAQPHGAPQTILAIKPSGDADYRVILKRARGFNSDDRLYIERFIQESQKYHAGGFDFASHVGIIETHTVAHLLAPNQEQVVSKVISCLNWFRERTYEGEAISFGVIVDLDNNDGEKKNDILNFYRKDFFIVLSNGVNTYVEVDASGYVKKYAAIDRIAENNSNVYAPLPFVDFCLLTSEKKVGFLLTKNGDILIFKDKEMRFARRRGFWRLFSHKKIISQISSGKGKSTLWRETIRQAVYLTALDVSFMHTGGLVYIATQRYKNHISSCVCKSDIFGESEYSDKARLLGFLFDGKNFEGIERAIRKEICSIDGAVLLCHDGRIASIGAIVNKSTPLEGGARSAAAIALSEKGFSIKISADGEIKGYYRASQKDAEPKFVCG